MKIRQELDNNNPKIKIGYNDLGHVHKESNCIKKKKKNNKEKKKKKFVSIIQVPLIHMIRIQIFMDLVQNGSISKPNLSTHCYF